MKKTEEIKLKRIIADNFKSGINRKGLMDSLRTFINDTYIGYEEPRTVDQRIEQLNRILIARLPNIGRWGNVEARRSELGFFEIVWSVPKRTNTHPYETKQIPIKDLDKIINRNLIKLNKSIVSYK